MLYAYWKAASEVLEKTIFDNFSEQKADKQGYTVSLNFGKHSSRVFLDHGTPYVDETTIVLGDTVLFYNHSYYRTYINNNSGITLGFEHENTVFVGCDEDLGHFSGLGLEMIDKTAEEIAAELFKYLVRDTDYEAQIPLPVNSNPVGPFVRHRDECARAIPLNKLYNINDYKE